MPVVARLFHLQLFPDLGSWGHENHGVLEMLVLASLKYDRGSLRLSIFLKKCSLIIKNSAVLWVKKVQACLAVLLYSTVLVLRRFDM